MVLPVCSKDELLEFYNLEKYYTQSGSHFLAKSQTFFDKVLIKVAWWFDDGVQMSADQINARFSLPGSVCDIGCGDGHLLRSLQVLGWSIHGVEPDPSAKSYGDKNPIPILHGTAEELPAVLARNQFDLVIMSHVLEHTMDPDLAISNAHGLLKSGGFILIEVPNKDAVHFQMFRAASDCFDVPRHQYFFGLSSLKKMLERKKFEVTEYYHHGLTRHHSPDWRETERKIRFDIVKTDIDRSKLPPDHSLMKSVKLLIKEMFGAKLRRFDAIGVWARKS
jgi:2-polyprenyl-3-methyl-5-hydroxy-6-metoxy-1,4-benzoquinol methylase